MTIHDLRTYCLWIYLFSINYEMYDPTGIGILSLAKISALLYMASFIGNPLPFISIKGIEKIVRPLFLFYAFYTLINIINVNYYNSMFLDFPLLNNILIMLLLINHERYYPGALDKGLLAFAFGSITLAILYQFNIGVEYTDDNRVSLFGDNENTIGVRMALSINILLYVVFKNHMNLSIWRYIYLLPVPIMILLLGETGSRKAFITLILSLGIFMIFYRTKYFHTKFFIGVIGLIAGIVIYNELMQIEVLGERITETREEGSLGGREKIWQKVIPHIMDNLIVGAGKTGYSLYGLKTFGKFASPHNVILELLAYTGIIGLFLYLWFYISSFLLSIRTYLITKHFINILIFLPIFGLLLAGQMLATKMAYLVFAYSISRIFYLQRIKNENLVLHR